MPALLPFCVIFLAILVLCLSTNDMIIMVTALSLVFSIMISLIFIIAPVGTTKYETVIPKHIMKDFYCVVAIVDYKNFIVSTDALVVNNELEQIEVIKTITYNGYNRPLPPTYKISVKPAK